MKGKRIVIVGAGGHGQVVADIFLRMRDAGDPIETIAFLDDNPITVGSRVLGLEVVGPSSDIKGLRDGAFGVALGDNIRRKDLYESLERGKYDLAIARHPRRSWRRTWL